MHVVLTPWWYYFWTLWCCLGENLVKYIKSSYGWPKWYIFLVKFQTSTCDGGNGRVISYFKEYQYWIFPITPVYGRQDCHEIKGKFDIGNGCSTLLWGKWLLLGILLLCSWTYLVVVQRLNMSGAKSELGANWLWGTMTSRCNSRIPLH